MSTRTSPSVPLEERERLRHLAEKVLESERGMPMVEPVVVDGKEFQAMYVSMADVEISKGQLARALAPDVVLRLLAMLDDTEKTLREADDLLRRLGEWDMLSSPGGKPVTADGPYWQREIGRTRAALARLGAGGEDG